MKQDLINSAESLHSSDVCSSLKVLQGGGIAGRAGAAGPARRIVSVMLALAHLALDWTGPYPAQPTNPC